MLSTKSPQLASWILYLFVLAVSAQSGCNHDDCYNALFPCESPGALAEALNYCSTVGRYGATNYPPRATAACGNSNKQAYMSACACSVACPTVLSITESSCASTISASSTFTTSIRASGNSQPSFSSPSSISSTSSASTLTSLGSPVSTNTNSGTATSTSPTLSTTAGTDPSSLDPASSTGTSSSDPSSSTGTVPSDSGLSSSVLSTTSVLTTSTQTSSDPTSASSNTSGTLSSTSSGPSGGPSSISPSTFTSNTTATATISLSSVLSSSTHWTNTTSTPGAPTSLGDPGTSSSTLLDPSLTSDPSSSSTASSVDSVPSTSATSSETLSTFPTSAPTFTSTSGITGSGVSSSVDTTCIETPGYNSLHHYLNSTASRGVPSVTGGIFSIMPVPSAPTSLNLTRTHTRTRTRTHLSSTESSSTAATTTTTSSTSTSASCTPAPLADTSSIENGDFERGLSPWSVDLVDVMSTHYETAGPGADGSCSAFRVRMRRNSQTDDLRANLRLVSPMVAPPPGSRWTVSFWVRWAEAEAESGAGGDSYINLYANYAVAHRVDATSSNVSLLPPPLPPFTYMALGVKIGSISGMMEESSGPGKQFTNSRPWQWTRVEFPYTTGEDRNLQFVFSFALGGAPTNEVWIDKVAMDVVGTATPTSSEPVFATVKS
ncbi:hypothetical protein F4818DRAFT_455135 [Hypoxylon cercidicola]|nr:hypothetical protein F4818DRAFT_455135 [Hypoxylon cercidicola]